MSVERVIATFIGIGVALCIAIALMPVTGSLLVFLIAVVGGFIFLVRGMRDLRTQSSPRIHSPQPRAPARRWFKDDAPVIPLPPRRPRPPDQPTHA